MIKRLILISFMYFCTTALALQQSNQPYTGLHTNIPIGQIEGVELSINLAFPQTPSATVRAVAIQSAPQQAKRVFAEYLAFIKKWAE